MDNSTVSIALSFVGPSRWFCPLFSQRKPYNIDFIAVFALPVKIVCKETVSSIAFGPLTSLKYHNANFGTFTLFVDF